jgi:hypothetical protein
LVDLDSFKRSNASKFDEGWPADPGITLKVVALVVFNLKGAFNGVKKTSLETHLQAKGIPQLGCGFTALWKTSTLVSTLITSKQRLPS